MYKDKDKQREANRVAQARFKAKQQGITEEQTDRVLLRNKDKGITLHPAIIATINRLTTNLDGTVDEQARTTRMANAMHYEQVCPGRPYTGAAMENRC